MTEYQYVIQIVVTNQAVGNALAVALGTPGDSVTFNDDRAMCLTKDGSPAWATEVVVRQGEYDTACEFRDGVNPASLGLSSTQFSAALAVCTIRCGTRDIQYTLRDWVTAQGYSIGE
jgi:hypothetical protein